MRRVALGGLVIASVPLGMVAGGGAGASPVLPNRPACAPVPGPGDNAWIGNEQNGKKICVRVGEKLLVTLSAPPSSGLDWERIRVSPPGVLTAGPPTLMLARGVTAANFLAAHPGVAHLSSQRMVCSPPKSQVACGAKVSWKATVVVGVAQTAFGVATPT
jgi:hypothetical protein